MSARPNYAAKILAPAQATLNTANANRDGSTGTYQLVMSGDTASNPEGVVIEDVLVKALGQTTAGMIRWFLSTDNPGTQRKLIHETPVFAVNPNANTPTFRTKVPELVGMTFKDDNVRLHASTEKGETLMITVQRAGCGVSS